MYPGRRCSCVDEYSLQISDTNQKSIVSLTPNSLDILFLAGHLCRPASMSLAIIIISYNLLVIVVGL